MRIFSSSVGRGRQGATSARRSALALLLAITPAPAIAQGMLATPPPIRTYPDSNGVDMMTGAFTLSVKEVTIGQVGAGGLSYGRDFHGNGWRTDHTGVIKSVGSQYTVSIGGLSETFTESSGVFTNGEGLGSTLTFDVGSQTYVYTAGDGTVVVFSKALAETSPLEANEGKVVSVTLPTGEKTTYTYKSVIVGGTNYNRLQSVNNNFGYQLKFVYSLNNPVTMGDLSAFRDIVSVTGVNNAVDFCDPAADNCSYSQVWPSITYGTPGGAPMARTATDSLGRVNRYTYDSGGRIVGLRRPSASSDTMTLSYDAEGLVNTVSNGIATWSYDFTVDGESGLLTAVATDPLSHTRTVVTDTNLAFVRSDTDALGRTTSFVPDAFGRVSMVYRPYGDRTEFTYDARGNVTQTKVVAKPGTGGADIVSSATFDSTCSNPVKCNKPNTTTDVNGAVTTYAYDSVHGGLLTVTSPPPIMFTIPAETRVTYTSLYAWYKQGSGGSVSQAATPVTLPTLVCSTNAIGACNTAAEAVTSTTYGAAGVANNLLPTSTSSGAANGSLTATTTFTYDPVGNLNTIDGPLAGPDDTAKFRWNAGRQLVGVVGPDPDGGGARLFPATRYGHNFDGHVVTVEQGTVTSQSDAAWAAMVVLQQQTTTYDATARVARQSFASGGSTQAVTQISYDVAGRTECVALRMNSSVFGALPTSACTLGAAGPDGPDRITRFTYNSANQVLKRTEAYGTSAQQDTVTFAYGPSGLPSTVADAMGGLTTYEYDGFANVKKIRYPIPNNRTSSSTSDYEEFTYLFGLVSQHRRRDGSTFGYIYDGLLRPLAIDMPGGLPDVFFSFDDLNRVTQVATSAQAVGYAYDALGRRSSETTPLGTTAYQYDIASRRTRIT